MMISTIFILFFLFSLTFALKNVVQKPIISTKNVEGLLKGDILKSANLKSAPYPKWVNHFMCM
jgi:hypothetical protein